jgi:hypothetical protein
MVRRSHDIPAWRVFGAMLGAFAIGVQLLLSGWLIGQVAAAADQADMLVVCSHDPSGAADDSGIPPAHGSHSQCPACACPLSAKLLAPPPASPSFVVPRLRSEALPSVMHVVLPELRRHSPYSSRAPPLSA